MFVKDTANKQDIIAVIAQCMKMATSGVEHVRSHNLSLNTILDVCAAAQRLDNAHLECIVTESMEKKDMRHGSELRRLKNT